MKDRLVSAIAGLLALFTILATFTASQPNANTGVPDTEDSRKIQAVLQRSYDLEAQVWSDFDPALFATVFINDPRVPLSRSTIAFIQRVKIRQGETPRDDYGFLDYKLAYYGLRDPDAAQAAAILPRARQDKGTQAEAGAQTTAPRTESTTGPLLSPRLKIYSITIHRDMADAVFDDGPRLNSMRLARIGGEWFIAGWTILQVHA